MKSIALESVNNFRKATSFIDEHQYRVNSKTPAGYTIQALTLVKSCEEDGKQHFFPLVQFKDFISPVLIDMWETEGFPENLDEIIAAEKQADIKPCDCN